MVCERIKDATNITRYWHSVASFFTVVQQHHSIHTYYILGGQERIIEKSREEERVTQAVTVVTAESPACTINRTSCYIDRRLFFYSMRA